MTNWQEYGEALELALTHAIEAERAGDRDTAIAEAEAGLDECVRALDLATSPTGERLAVEHGDRLAALIVTYQERKVDAWPAPREAGSGSGCGEALNAGLAHGREALDRDNRAEAAELYAKAAGRLAEAALAARSHSWRDVARRAHRRAARQVERAANPEEWALSAGSEGLLQSVGAADRNDRERRAAAGVSH